VTAMRIRLHNLPNVLSGMLVYPFSEAKSVLEGCIDLAASTPEDLTVQLGFVGGPDGAPVVLVAPTWCGPPGQGDAQVGPFHFLDFTHAPCPKNLSKNGSAP